jgi:hypothetical protein
MAGSWLSISEPQGTELCIHSAAYSNVLVCRSRWAELGNAGLAVHGGNPTSPRSRLLRLSMTGYASSAYRVLSRSRLSLLCLFVFWMAGSPVPSPAGPSRQRRAKPTYRAEKQGASPISRCYEILFLGRESHVRQPLRCPPPSTPFVLVYYPVRSLATRVYERFVG